jgi:hypothetical protein
MPSPMRMAISATTLLGLVLLALAMGGISSMANDLEAAAPQRALPAPASEEFRSREIDCPAEKRERRQL